jgi:hypothetical protein
VKLLQQLIDKNDGFEVVRNQIAAILVSERDNQKALALEVDPPQEPSDYDFSVYIERSNPWEQFLADNADLTPIINIWYNNSDFDGMASTTVERQKTVGVFNIDCYGAGVSQGDGAGHIPGDERAALETQRALRLVRNILMASQNTYLQLQGLVWQRWPQAVTMFQPQMDSRPLTHVVAGRLALRVTFNELSPQYIGEPLEYVAIGVKRASDGQIIINSDYDYTL